MQSILHAHLVPPCPHADLLGPKGRAWLLAQALPPDEQDAVARHLREHDRLSEDLRVIERELARDALADPDVKRLMTIPGIDMVVGVSLMAAIGAVERFDGPDKLVAYLGLNPSVHQSGEARPRHGRITNQGRTHARTMLVEAAWQAVRGPGPSRPKPPTAGRPRAGRDEGQRCPQAPQRRSGYEGCAAGLAPRALLCAGRSPVGERRIAPDHAKGTVQPHPYALSEFSVPHARKQAGNGGVGQGRAAAQGRHAAPG